MLTEETLEDEVAWLHARLKSAIERADLTQDGMLLASLARSALATISTYDSLLTRRELDELRAQVAEIRARLGDRNGHP